MAKIVEEVVVLKVSKLVRGTDKSAPILPEDFVASLEAVATEVLGDAGAMVEVMTLDQFGADSDEG
jgi:hypothetical protein